LAKHNKNILIVENEIIVADDISRVVSELGHNPLNPALGFQQATDTFIKYLPDLVILDIRLNSSKSGLDFAKWVRQQNETPIVYLTVFEDQSTIQSCEQTNASAYLIKPFLDQELKTAISEALQVQNEP